MRQNITFSASKIILFSFWPHYLSDLQVCPHRRSNHNRQTKFAWLAFGTQWSEMRGQGATAVLESQQFCQSNDSFLEKRPAECSRLIIAVTLSCGAIIKITGLIHSQNCKEKYRWAGHQSFIVIFSYSVKINHFYLFFQCLIKQYYCTTLKLEWNINYI